MASQAQEPTPSRLWRAIHLTAVGAFAVAQPLLDMVGRYPTFLVAHGAEAVDVALVLAVLLIGTPALLICLQLALGLVSRRVEDLVHGALIGLGLGLVALQALRRLELGHGLVAVGAACLAAVAGAWVYRRLPQARTVATFLCLGLLIFPISFLMKPGVRSVVWPRDVAGDASLKIAADSPVVLVVFDELPVVTLMTETGLVDAGRFPAFAALADQGLWFRNAFTVADFTIQALPAILTGRHVPLGLVPVAADYPESLFTFLGGSYSIHASEPLTRICPQVLCPEDEVGRDSVWTRVRGLLSDLKVVYMHLVIPTEWAGRLPPVSDSWAGFGRNAAEDQQAENGSEDPSQSGETPESDEESARNAWRKRWDAGVREDKPGHFQAMVDRIDDSPRALYFIHTLLPHSPYWYLPSGRQYDVDVGVAGLDLRRDQWVDDEWVVAQAEKRHLLQVGFVDHLLGRLIARLKDVGIYDRALIVVTADHGSSFAPGSRRRNLTATNRGEIIAVPLLVKPPGAQKGRVVDRPVATVDILPTIADVLETELPWLVDGRSLLAGGEGRETIRVMVRGKGQAASS